MIRIIGVPVTGGVQIRNAAGSLADPTSISGRLFKPDGTSADLPVSRSSTGVYAFAFIPAAAGRYAASIVAAGDNAAADPAQLFDVWPAVPRMLIPLEEARAALNLSAADTSRDEELQLYIAAATEVIEDIAGPILTGTAVETFDGGRGQVLLSKIPSAVTRVTENGQVITDVTADLQSGIVHCGMAHAPRLFAPGMGTIEVTYTYGSGTVPYAVTMACRELVAHSWQIGQQAVRPAFGGPDADLAFTPSGFLVPKRVIEYCAPLASANRVPGFA